MPVVTRQVSSVRGTKSSRPVPPPVLGVIRVPEPVLTGLYCHNETPLLITRIIHQIQLIRGITN
ncbi:Transposase [Shigella dysenteriae 1617]|nr:Transposase [Shigella dysenteriae 1617]